MKNINKLVQEAINKGEKPIITFKGKGGTSMTLSEDLCKKYKEQAKKNEEQVHYPELDIIEVCGTTMVMTPEEAETWEKYQKEHPIESDN